MDLHDIRPAVHPLAARLAHAVVEGRLTASMTLHLSHGRWQDGKGRLIMQGDAGSIAGLEIGSLRLPSLAYEHLASELTLQDRSVVVTEFQIRGLDWQVDLQGKVKLNEYLQHSPIDLTLRVRTSDVLEQQLGFVGTLLKQRRDRRGFAALKINGTVEHPNPVL
jgi:type II secretion system protein N